MENIQFNYSITKNYIHSSIKCFLYISFLKESGVISEVKYKGMLSSLRNGTFNTYRKTHHSSINDKWYSDESMENIMRDICEKSVASTYTISFEQMIVHVNLLLNKNRNFCIDYIFTHIIKPSIQNYNGHNQNQIIDSLGLKLTYNLRTPHDNELTSGYCCGDCDGDVELYKAMRYEYYYLNSNKKEIEKYVKSFLLSKRNEGNPITPSFNIF